MLKPFIFRPSDCLHSRIKDVFSFRNAHFTLPPVLCGLDLDRYIVNVNK